MLKLVYSLGVEGRLEIGRGDCSPELKRGVNGSLGRVDRKDDRTGFTLFISTSLHLKDLQIRTG